MDCFSTYDFIEDWWANNGGRAKNMSVQIQKITDEYLEIGLDGNILQLTIPKNFTADGIIRSTDCAFVVTLTRGKDESSSTDSVQELIIALNEKLDRLSSHGNYSFRSVLDSVLDTLEKYKNCSDSEAMAVEIYNDEDAGSISDGEGYSTATSPVSAPEEFLLKRLYFHQLADDANRTCDLARTVAMSARVEVKDLKDDILRCCRLHLPGFWCVRIEMELTGILSHQYRHRHVHVFEALGFSFATPLLIELKFDSWNMEKDSRSGESLGNALQGVSAWHEGVDSKLSHNARNFACNKALPAELHETIRQAIDDSEVDPVHLYGVRFLLPRMTRDFFSAGGRDPDNDNDKVLACEDNIFVRLLLFIGSRLNSLLKRCIVCNKELPFAVSKLCSCSDELCLFGFEVLGWGAQVLPEVKSKPVELLDLEISFAFCAAKNELRDVFEPFPPFLLKGREIRQRSGFFNNNKNSSGSDQSGGSNLQQNKNMEVLRSIINSFPPVSEMRLCANEVELKAKLAISWLSGAMNSVKVWADKYFGKEAWQLPYNVLRFILCTNRLSLVFISEDEDKLLKDADHTAPYWKCYQFAVVQDSPEREAHLESLRTTKLPAGTHGSCSWYPNIPREKKPWYSNILKKLKSSRSKPHKSSRSKPQCSKFLFHGSNADNWYSILRNGLRCLSSTALMSRGNTSGDGIYMAKYLNVSACYGFETGLAASSLFGWKNGMYKDGFYVVSICEIISCPIKKRTKAKECVVPKEYEGNVAVRYLLVNTCSKTHKDYVALTKCRCCFGAYIRDGKTWHDRANNNKINLHEHYQYLRQKYLSSSREYERPALIAQLHQ